MTPPAAVPPHEAGPPDETGPPDAFISYAREQKEFARRLVDAVRARGKTVWIDWKDIRPTADWRAEVRSAIEEARAFVFVLGPDSLASEICEEELVHAVASNKRIVPVVLEEVDPKRVPKEVAAPNWIFCRPEDDFEAAVEILIEALETDLDWLDRHARLLVRATEWKATRFDSSYLLRGSDLAAAEAWLAEEAEHRERATPLQREYATASRAAADRRRRLVIGSASVAVVVAAGLAIFAWQQRERAGTEADRAESRSLAAASIDEVRTDPWEALELAVTARETSDTPEATDALRRALDAPRESAVLEMPGTSIRAARFTPDSEQIVTTGYDGNVQRWNLATGESEVVRTGPAPPAEDLPETDLSPDGTLRLRADSAGVRLEDAHVGTALIELDRLGRPSEGADLVAEFSPDGNSFLTVGYGPAVRVWPLTLRRLSVERVAGGAVSPDGQRCLTANGDATATLWSCEDGEELRTWTLPESEFSSFFPGSILPVSFTADGSRTAVSVGTTTLVADADSGEELFRLTAPDLAAPPSISPSGLRAARVFADQTAEIIELPGEQRVEALPPDYPVLGEQLVFSEDDERILIAHRQETVVRVWDLTSDEEVAAIGPFERPVEEADLSSDGSLVVTASDTSVELWDAAGGRRIRGLPPQDLVITAGFATDDRFLVTGAADGTARVWETSSGRLVATHVADPGIVGEVAMGGDGRLLAIGLRGSGLVFDCSACLPAPELLAEARAELQRRPAQPGATGDFES